MAKIAFLSFPQYGHVFPEMPIVAELVRRGHRVTVFNEARFEAMSRQTGAAFVAYPDVMPHAAFTRALTDGDLVWWLQLLLTSALIRLSLCSHSGVARWVHYAVKQLSDPCDCLVRIWPQLVGNLTSVR